MVDHHEQEYHGHIQGNRMQQHPPQSKDLAPLEEGSFESYPEITPKTVESLKSRGIVSLFPI